MSYYTEVGFVVVFRHEQDLLTWLASTALSIQDMFDTGVDDHHAQIFNDGSAMQDFMRKGECVQLGDTYHERTYAFRVHTVAKYLPSTYQQILDGFAGASIGLDGSGGFVAQGEDYDDYYISERCEDDLFNIYDFYNIERSVYVEKQDTSKIKGIKPSNYFGE
jgi:hypothetical protein